MRPPLKFFADAPLIVRMRIDRRFDDAPCRLKLNRTNMKTTACLIGSLILAGCASAGRIGDLPQVATGAASSTLVIARPTNLIGMANSLYVALDGKDVFSIRSGQNTHFPIPAGPHAIAVKCFGGWSPTWKEDSKPFVAERNQIDYFSISPNLTCAEIRQVDETEGEALLERTTFVDPAVSSNRDIQSPESSSRAADVQSRASSSVNPNVQSSPVASSQCPIQLRHGVREPVCASQAISPPMAPSAAAALPSTTVQSMSSLATLETPTPPVSAPTALSHARTVTKIVGGKPVACQVPLPEYPSEAKQNRQTGTFTVRITVWPPNIVKQLTMSESSGNALLDAAAMRAAEGTVCTSAEQRFQLFQSFEFDFGKSSSERSGDNATVLAQ